MKTLFSVEGLTAMKGAIAAFLALCALGAALVWFSERFVTAETETLTQVKRSLADAQAKLASARQQATDFSGFSERYALLARAGLFKGENRLAVIESLNALKANAAVSSIESQIDAQRAPPLPGGVTYPSLDVMSTRVRVKFEATHEGHALDVIERMRHLGDGYFALDTCRLARGEVQRTSIAAQIKGECELEWITLRPKRGANPASAPLSP